MLSQKRASILLIVLITIAFASLAMLSLSSTGRATTCLVAARAAEANRLRADAYSALEVTLGVLNEFIQVDGALHSPAEGWSDPLGFAGYEPASGRTVEVSSLRTRAKASRCRMPTPTSSPILPPGAPPSRMRRNSPMRCSPGCARIMWPAPTPARLIMTARPLLTRRLSVRSARSASLPISIL